MNSERHLQNKITIITFACSLLVIWVHTFNLEVYGITAEAVGFGRVVYYLETYWDKMTQIAVPMFFMISGFLFFRTFSIDKIMDKYKSRIKSLVIPYLCWCTLYYIYYVLISSIPFIKSMINEADIVALSLKSWIDALWMDSYYTLWFLKHLMEFVLITPVFYVLLKNWRKIPTGTIILGIILLNDYFEWISVIPGIDMYALGAWIALNYKEYTLYKNKKLSFLSWIYIIWMLITTFKWYNTFTEILLFIAIWYALDIKEYQNELPWWMKITFFIYVVHDVFLEALEKIFYIIAGNNPVMAIIDYIFMPIIVLGVVIMIASVLKTYFSLFWKLLTGGR